jgi:hypothetical protein
VNASLTIEWLRAVARMLVQVHEVAQQQQNKRRRLEFRSVRDSEQPVLKKPDIPRCDSMPEFAAAGWPASGPGVRAIDCCGSGTLEVTLTPMPGQPDGGPILVPMDVGLAAVPSHATPTFSVSLGNLGEDPTSYVPPMQEVIARIPKTIPFNTRSSGPVHWLVFTSSTGNPASVVLSSPNLGECQ